MPRLSQSTLEKRFQCPHCGETFRTRQGLSGHIQWKHFMGTGAEENDDKQSFLDPIAVQVRAEIMGFNKKEIGEMMHILVRWKAIVALVENEHITFNNADYKNYLIVSLAQMRANTRLHQELVSELAGGMEAGFTRLEDMITTTMEQS